MIGIILLLSWRTILRSFDFRDDMTLVKHDLNVSQSYTLELLLSYAYFEKGDYQHAKEHAEKSIALFPYETNYQNLGTADFYLGDYAGARTADFQALRYGESQTVYDNLGSLTLLSGDEKDNRALLQQALRKFSFDALLWRDLALFEYKYGHTDVAKNDITQAFHLNSSQEIYSAYMTIMNNEPLRIRASPGDNQ